MFHTEIQNLIINRLISLTIQPLKLLNKITPLNPNSKIVIIIGQESVQWKVQGKNSFKLQNLK